MAESEQTSLEKKDAGNLSRRRALVVEDSTLQREIITGFLQGNGYDVISAKNGVEAISKIYLEAPDIVVSDVVMPQLDGYQLCRLLKNDRVLSSIPVILLTSVAKQKRDKFWGLRAGADLYIMKDSSYFQNLLQSMEQLLAKKREKVTFRGVESDMQNGEMEGSNLTAQLNFLLDRLLFEQTLMNETKKLSSLVHNRTRCLNELAEFIESLVDYDCLCICMVHADSYEMNLYGTGEFCQEHLMTMKDVIASDYGRVTILGEPRLYCNVISVTEATVGDSPIQSSFITSLKVGNEYMGSLSIYSKGEDRFTSDITDSITIIAQEFSPVLKLMLLYEENRMMAISDNLTKLYNFRFFQENFQKEIIRSKRYKLPMTVAIMDVDKFKTINDSFGHLTGDYVLQTVASLLKAGIRKTDILARYGGDEFVLLLPHTDETGGLILAERLRTQVESYQYNGLENHNVTISVGMACCTENFDDATKILKAADGALYQSKAGGRNMTQVATL